MEGSPERCKIKAIDQAEKIKFDDEIVKESDGTEDKGKVKHIKDQSKEEEDDGKTKGIRGDTKNNKDKTDTMREDTDKAKAKDDKDINNYK